MIIFLTHFCDNCFFFLVFSTSIESIINYDFLKGVVRLIRAKKSIFSIIF